MVARADRLTNQESDDSYAVLLMSFAMMAARTASVTRGQVKMARAIITVEQREMVEGLIAEVEALAKRASDSMPPNPTA